MTLIVAMPRDYLSHGFVTVGTSAIVIRTADGDRFGIAIYNKGNATLYIGMDNTVLTATGFPVEPNTGLYLDGYTGALWGICDAADQSIRYLEV